MAEDSAEREVVYRELDTDAKNPGTQVAEIVAELKGTRATELATMYGCVDGVIDHVFSDPPSPEADLAVEFSYEDYRVTVEQDGAATFVKTG